MMRRAVLFLFSYMKPPIKNTCTNSFTVHCTPTRNDSKDGLMKGPFLFQVLYRFEFVKGRVWQIWVAIQMPAYLYRVCIKRLNFQQIAIEQIVTLVVSSTEPKVQYKVVGLSRNCVRDLEIAVIVVGLYHHVICIYVSIDGAVGHCINGKQPEKEGK